MGVTWCRPRRSQATNLVMSLAVEQVYVFERFRFGVPGFAKDQRLNRSHFSRPLSDHLFLGFVFRFQLEKLLVYNVLRFKGLRRSLLGALPAWWLHSSSECWHADEHRAAAKATAQQAPIRPRSAVIGGQSGSGTDLKAALCTVLACYCYACLVLAHSVD